MTATEVGATSSVKDAVAMWALKQTMAMRNSKVAEAITTAPPPAPEHGKGTLIDVKL